MDSGGEYGEGKRNRENHIRRGERGGARCQQPQTEHNQLLITTPVAAKRVRRRERMVAQERTIGQRCVRMR
jgi:hypothetical protein